MDTGTGRELIKRIPEKPIALRTAMIARSFSVRIRVKSLSKPANPSSVFGGVMRSVSVSAPFV